MEIIEVSGRTLQEAVQLAAQQFGVGTDDIEYEVVEEGTKGFLGLGQSPTLVRAHLREGVQPSPRPAHEQEIEELQEETQVMEELPAAASRAKRPISSRKNLTRISADVVKAMGVDAKPVVKFADEDEVEVDLVGDDVAILIGKHGQTLDALQYLMGMCAGKGSA